MSQDQQKHSQPWDKQSPRHYELRAGWPLPDDEWYRHTTNDDASRVPTYSHDKFVRGFNITVKRFYEIREEVEQWFKDRHWEEEDISKNMNVKAALYDLWEKLSRDLPDTSERRVPEKWRHDMLFALFSNVKADMARKRKLETGSEEWTPTASWSWGPDAQSPKGWRSHILQYQHLRICISRDNPDMDPKTIDQGSPSVTQVKFSAL